MVWKRPISLNGYGNDYRPIKTTVCCERFCCNNTFVKEDSGVESAEQALLTLESDKRRGLTIKLFCCKRSLLKFDQIFIFYYYIIFYRCCVACKIVDRCSTKRRNRRTGPVCKENCTTKNGCSAEPDRSVVTISTCILIPREKTPPPIEETPRLYSTLKEFWPITAWLSSWI